MIVLFGTKKWGYPWVRVTVNHKIVFAFRIFSHFVIKTIRFQYQKVINLPAHHQAMKSLNTRNSDEKIPVGKIICLAQNYHKHAEEMRSTVPPLPYFFLKPATSLIPDGGTILLPPLSKCVHHEVELYFVIKEEGKSIPREKADEYILGYGLLFDITARDIQSEGKKSGRPFGISKSFDTFAPLSAMTPAEVVGGWREAQDLEIRLETNGELRQHSSTKFMMFTIDRLVEFLSSVMTLERGDIIATGTPEGVSEIVDGDILYGEIQRLGSLTAKVKRLAD